MSSHAGRRTSRQGRKARYFRPLMVGLEHRVVLALTFPGIAGVAFDSSGDVFISYNSTSGFSGQQQSVAEVSAAGNLLSTSVFGTTGTSAEPGVLTTVGASASLPGITNSSDILELQPNGQIFVFNPTSGAGSQYDDLANDTPTATSVYNVQTNSDTDLSSQINLATATYGDFGVYGNSLVVAAESNNWDFVMRITYSAQGVGTAKVLAASPASDGLTASPEGVAVDSQGTVLTTLPYLPSGSTTATHVAVGFNLFYDQGNSPQPYVPTLGLTAAPEIDSGGITVDSQNNFLLAVRTSSVYGGGPGIAHINSALDAFLADPTTSAESTPYGIAFQNVDGSNYLAFTAPSRGTYTYAGELPLFSGQVSPAQLRNAYGVNQISFPGPNGTTVAGTGAGQTIAIVEEGVDPTLQADLTTFDQFFGIAAPPNFQVIDQNGVTTQNVDIVGEASLDVEWAHAIAPGASIVVYNAAYEPSNATQSYLNLIEAMQEASKLPGVSVVTLSYGEPESAVAGSGINEKQLDSDFTTAGVTFLAASGDSGIYGDGGRQVAANYPSASPDIVSVGGTSIVIDSAGDYPGTGSSGETAWGDGTSSGSDGGGGGGLSSIEAEPSWQDGVVPTSMDPTGERALPDVSMDSGAAQEYDVFTSTLSASSDSASAVGWLGDAGTSAASPIWAGLIAIADQGRVLEGGTPLTGYNQTLPALYSLPSADFHDIVSGNNGDAAAVGYDLATGLGTPVANLLVPDLAGYDIASHLTITTEPPASVAIGQTFGLTVQVKDSLGNPITGGTVTIALGSGPSGGTLGGTLTQTITNGTATFNGLSLNQAGQNDTLTATVTGTTISATSSSISVAEAPNATQVAVTSSPASAVVGASVTLDATVSEISPGAGVPAGTVTFAVGSTTLGSASLANGVASLSITPSSAGSETIKVSYQGDAIDQPSSITYVLTISQAAATLSLSNLSATYDESAHAATVTTNPPGISGVSVVYSQNGTAVSSPTQAGSYSVTATLNNANYTATPASGTLVIAQAVPTLSWTNPTNISVGTALGSAQLDATATFNGTAIAGTFTYDPPLGTVLAQGNNQTLTVHFQPADSTDFQAVSASVAINVDAQGTSSPSPSPDPTPTPGPTPSPTPSPTPAPITIVGESPVFRRKTNSHGKAVGKAVLSQFVLDFSAPLDAATAGNPANYQIDSVTTKKVKKKVERVVQALTNFSVSYTPGSDQVALNFAGNETFPTGGQITVSGVSSQNGGALGGTTVFVVSKGGKSLVPS